MNYEDQQDEVQASRHKNENDTNKKEHKHKTEVLYNVFLAFLFLPRIMSTFLKQIQLIRINFFIFNGFNRKKKVVDPLIP